MPMARCRIQLLSTFQYDPTIVAKHAFLRSRRWKRLPHPKICRWGNSNNCIQCTRSIGYSTTVRAYEDCEDSICQLIPCTLCKNVSEAMLVVCFLWFQQSCRFLACFCTPSSRHFSHSENLRKNFSLHIKHIMAQKNYVHILLHNHLFVY